LLTADSDSELAPDFPPVVCEAGALEATKAHIASLLTERKQQRKVKAEAQRKKKEQEAKEEQEKLEAANRMVQEKLAKAE
jgi:hypothetical protein